jgi:pimeloyl-ACP methyl ester carboxylesterase
MLRDDVQKKRNGVAALLALLMLGALIGCTPPSSPQIRGADGPLPVEFNVEPLLRQLLADPTASPPGANDFDCEPTEEHPRPVVLVHPLVLTRVSWQTLSPLLANNGSCVFALTYGSLPGVPQLGGLRSIEDSSHELDAFIDDVLAATGAEEVDLVGHSEGTVMPQYYLKRLGGAAKVNSYVAITPLYDGSTGWGVDQFIHSLTSLPNGVGDAFTAFFESVCGACRDALHGSTFNEELYGDGVVAVPGVQYTTILTRHDEIVTPYTSGFLDAPNATNIVLQDGCEEDLSEHLSAAFTPRAMDIVLNALDPEHAVAPVCVPTIPAYGLPGG